MNDAEDAERPPKEATFPKAVTEREQKSQWVEDFNSVRCLGVGGGGAGRIGEKVDVSVKSGGRGMNRMNIHTDLLLLREFGF